MGCGVAVKMTRIAQVARFSTAGRLVSVFCQVKYFIINYDVARLGVI